jgi:hypothetical protein
MCFISLKHIFELGCILTKAVSFVSRKRHYLIFLAKSYSIDHRTLILNNEIIHYLPKYISSCTTGQYVGLYVH